MERRDWIQFGLLIVAIIGILFNAVSMVATKDDMNRRFDKVDAELRLIRQNHLEHITELHVRKIEPR